MRNPRTYLPGAEPLKNLTYHEFVELPSSFPDIAGPRCTALAAAAQSRVASDYQIFKQRQVEVIINSNGTLLTPNGKQALVESGLDQYRCSIDGARPELMPAFAGRVLPKLSAGLAGLVETKARLQAQTPQISIWCVGSTENLAELPDLVRLAARLGVTELYLQRLVYFAREPEGSIWHGPGRSGRLWSQTTITGKKLSPSVKLCSAGLGLDFRASGARDPRSSFAAARPSATTPGRNVAAS
ncbi:MAG: hypothetical protein U0401_16820 [Anaerolineae bacterium]